MSSLVSFTNLPTESGTSLVSLFLLTSSFSSLDKLPISNGIDPVNLVWMIVRELVKLPMIEGIRPEYPPPLIVSSVIFFNLLIVSKDSLGSLLKVIDRRSSPVKLLIVEGIDPVRLFFKIFSSLSSFKLPMVDGSGEVVITEIQPCEVHQFTDGGGQDTFQAGKTQIYINHYTLHATRTNLRFNTYISSILHSIYRYITNDTTSHLTPHSHVTAARFIISAMHRQHSLSRSFSSERALSVTVCTGRRHVVI